MYSASMKINCKTQNAEALPRPRKHQFGRGKETHAPVRRCKLILAAVFGFEISHAHLAICK